MSKGVGPEGAPTVSLALKSTVKGIHPLLDVILGQIQQEFSLDNTSVVDDDRRFPNLAQSACGAGSIGSDRPPSERAQRLP